MEVKVFDNILEIVREDMASAIKNSSGVSIVVSCFSLYDYKELEVVK